MADRDVLPSSVAVRAFAKVNLTLRVLGVRPDGFHELSTTYQSLSLHDDLVIVERRGRFEIACDQPACPVDRANLVWRAAELVWQALKRPGAPKGAAVRIIKRIPMEAGLGGGSSNGAAALRGLLRLWRAELRAEHVRHMAAQLGADVPFFLRGGTALGTGRGDQVCQLDDKPRVWIVLAVPPFGVSTREAYMWWDEQHAAKSDRAGAATEAGNDLERVVASRHPEVARLVRRLRGAGASYAGMSGSGSAVFGAFTARPAAEAAADQIASRAVAVLMTSTLSRSEFQRLSKPRVTRSA